MLKKRFYATTELANICHVNPSTIFRAIVNNTIEVAKTPGGHYRISSEEVERFLRKNNIPFPEEEARTAKILIVEDNPIELRLYQRTLEKDKRYEIKATPYGYEAGFLTRSFKPDLILLDIMLGGYDGCQIAKLVHADPELKKVKIAVITGVKDPKIIKDITSHHFDALIFKPIDPDELKVRVERLLS